MKRKFTEVNEEEDSVVSGMYVSQATKKIKKRKKKKQKLKLVSSANLSTAIKQDEDEEDFLYEFRMLSVRQPWADALIKNIKKIENRVIPIPDKILLSWLALHVSKTFGKAEKNTNGWVGRGENDELKETCGKIIGLIRFKACINSQEAKTIDPIFTDRPKKTKFHWLVDEVIALEEPIFHESNCRFPRVSDINARKRLSALLKENGETQYHVPPPQAKDQVFCEHCWKQFSKQKTLENHLKNKCEFTGDVKNKRKAISNFFLTKFR